MFFTTDATDLPENFSPREQLTLLFWPAAAAYQDRSASSLSRRVACVHIVTRQSSCRNTPNGGWRVAIVGAPLLCCCWDLLLWSAKLSNSAARPCAYCESSHHWSCWRTSKWRYGEWSGQGSRDITVSQLRISCFDQPSRKSLSELFVAGCCHYIFNFLYTWRLFNQIPKPTGLVSWSQICLLNSFAVFKKVRFYQ